MWSPCDGLVIMWSHVILTEHIQNDRDLTTTTTVNCDISYASCVELLMIPWSLTYSQVTYESLCSIASSTEACFSVDEWRQSRLFFAFIWCIAIRSLNLNKILFPSVILPSSTFHKYDNTIWWTMIVIYTCFVYLCSYIPNILVHPSCITAATLTDWL
jgi:hypothetical protein